MDNSLIDNSVCTRISQFICSILEDYYRIGRLGNASISPNGKWVCFTISYASEENNSTRSEIWIFPADGLQKPRRVTAQNLDCRSPVWTRNNLLSYINHDPVKNKDLELFLDVEKQGSMPFKDKCIISRQNISPDNRWIVTTMPTDSPKQEKQDYQSSFERRIEERFKGVRFSWSNFHSSEGGYVPDPRDPGASPSS
jgi:dipeptidyl aminopeptidase/acylaminoacyl peptidase